MPVINQPAPAFTADAFHKNDISKVSLSDYAGKWVVLVFYPADFRFICPTELGEIADAYDRFQDCGSRGAFDSYQHCVLSQSLVR